MEKGCKAQGVTTKDVLANSDIPYEVRMKYLIDAYRKDKVKWAKLAQYAKQLEAELNRLRQQISELKGRLKEQHENEVAIKQLQQQIDTFPLRIYKSGCFKRIIKFQRKYIEELQQLLDANDIPYALRLSDDPLETEGVDKVVDSAMEYRTRYEMECPPAPAP